MRIYIDENYLCYTEDAPGRRALDVPFFDGCGKRYIEGYRYIPDGEIFTRTDGEKFTGESITPVKNYDVIAAQDEADAAYQSLGEIVQMLYDSDMEAIECIPQ